MVSVEFGKVDTFSWIATQKQFSHVYIDRTNVVLVHLGDASCGLGHACWCKQTWLTVLDGLMLKLSKRLVGCGNTSKLHVHKCTGCWPVSVTGNTLVGWTLVVVIK